MRLRRRQPTTQTIVKKLNQSTDTCPVCKGLGEVRTRRFQLAVGCLTCLGTGEVEAKVNEPKKRGRPLKVRTAEEEAKRKGAKVDKTQREKDRKSGSRAAFVKKPAAVSKQNSMDPCLRRDDELAGGLSIKQRLGVIVCAAETLAKLVPELSEFTGLIIKHAKIINQEVKS